MNKLFIDLDGTLINNSFRQCLLLRNFIKLKNKKIDHEKVWSLKRSGYNNVEILAKYGIFSDSDLDTFKFYWKNNIESLFYLDFDFLFDGTISFLKKISRKYKLYLLSGRSNNFSATTQINKLKIINYFTTIFFVEPSKIIEQKRFYLKKYKPKYYIGDTEFDFISSCDITKFLAVSTGQRNKDFLNKKGVKFIFQNLDQIIRSNVIII
jgi:phosphoglycolate phosphatase-like HAD superfamily hydrolase